MGLFLATPVRANNSLKIEVRGVTGDELSNVVARLEAVEEVYSSNMSEAEIQDFLVHAPQHIQNALQPFGYFKAKVSVKLEHQTAIFKIDLGPAITISHVDVKLTGPGKDNPELQKYIQHLPIAAGQVLKTKQYENIKDELFQIANNQGYLKASLEKKEIRINLKKYTAAIIIYFNTGPRYYFGHVLFGPSPYAPSFLQRFVSIKEHEPYSSQKLLKLQQDMRDSRYFKQVDAEPDYNNIQDNTVPVNVGVIAPKSQRYDVGLGYGTFTGTRLTLGTEFRRITDTGQSLNAQLKLSSVLSSLTAKYLIPGKNPLTDQYAVGANIQYFAPKNGTSFSQSLSGSFTKTKEDWKNIYSINYLNEHYKVTGSPNHRSQVFYPAYTLSYLKADNIISPQYAKMLNFTLQGGSTNLFSKTSFVQSEIKGKYLFSPTANSHVIFRGDLGYTVVEDLNQLPLSMRYFAGGIGSVRGYPYTSLGPGKYLEVASAELQHRIYGDWFAAAFYDVGNASNTFNGQFFHGVGGGIIYQSFIGPIKLYAGRGRTQSGPHWDIEFSMGPDF